MRKKRKLFGIALVVSILFTTIYYSFIFVGGKYVLMPSDKIRGVDISHYQRDFPFNKIDQEQIQFVFIKATEGLSFKDPYFERNWQEASDNMILKGAYHFFHPTMDGKLQAEHFIKTVGYEKQVLRPVVDVEIYSKNIEKQLINELDKFIATIESFYGVTPIIYTNGSIYQKVIQANYDNYIIWIAHYTDNDKPSYIANDAWSFWQYTDTGKLDGYDGPLDLNLFNGTIEDLEKLVIK